ncbi:hypothetical protein O6P43_017923 [Quillaja saponaria]|uniref:Uncharacterized protein n=1 Tax=Quillaja saponaria TaxID=32244 RepID=A0AAD7LR08_QUISA|nr:hypothetical protein O6P43_017923 [Quillaja saponaria]
MKVTTQAMRALLLISIIAFNSNIFSTFVIQARPLPEEGLVSWSYLSMQSDVNHKRSPPSPPPPPKKAPPPKHIFPNHSSPSPPPPPKKSPTPQYAPRGPKYDMVVYEKAPPNPYIAAA